MKLTPQAALVLTHLQRKGTVTPVEAQAVHKVRHLPARIFELRRAGYRIVSHTLRDLTGQRYVRYGLELAA